MDFIDEVRTRSARFPIRLTETKKPRGIGWRQLAGVLLTLSIVVAYGTVVDTEAVIEEAIAIQMEMSEIETDRDRALIEYESSLDRVEKGPQMLLNVHLRLADTQEGNGWTVEAQRTRADAVQKFEANALVAAALQAEYRYYDLADLWVSKNLALGDLLDKLDQDGID